MNSFIRSKNIKSALAVHYFWPTSNQKCQPALYSHVIFIHSFIHLDHIDQVLGSFNSILCTIDSIPLKSDYSRIKQMAEIVHTYFLCYLSLHQLMHTRQRGSAAQCELKCRLVVVGGELQCISTNLIILNDDDNQI